MDNMKTLFWADGHGIHDKANVDSATHHKTDIIIRDEDTQEVIFRGSNKVILPGAAFTARRHFDFGNPPEVTPSYNEILGLDNSVPVSEPRPIYNEELTYLFAVGVDGCGHENSQVYPVNYSRWIMPESLVPFHYVPVDDDIDLALRDIYFGRKTNDNDMVAYYFKAFETQPVFIQQYVDGTPIDATVYDSLKTDEVESYVELHMKVLRDDCREWFINTTGIYDARVNTISLLTCWAKQIDGITYYQDIRPLTKLNFPNEPLIDLTKGLDITYHVYY